MLGGSDDSVGQGVAFPPSADSPPTAESVLPKPVVLDFDESDTTADPTLTPELADSPPAVPEPTQVSLTIAPPQIYAFSAVATGDKNSKTITFTWESSAATTARIYN